MRMNDEARGLREALGQHPGRSSRRALASLTAPRIRLGAEGHGPRERRRGQGRGVRQFAEHAGSDAEEDEESEQARTVFDREHD